MTKLLRTHGTTLTIALFLISTLSGVFLFFHLYSSTFHAMHEWLSMVLIAPVAVHMWRNWPAFSSYFKKKTIYVPLIVTLLVGVMFAYPSLSAGKSGGNPMRVAVGAIQNGTIEQVAPLFKLEPSQLKERLLAKGYKVERENQPLSELAKASGKNIGPALIADIAIEAE